MSEGSYPKEYVSHTFAVDSNAPQSLGEPQRSWIKIWLDKVYLGEVAITFGTEPLRVTSYVMQ